ncbi:hypothetical protein QQZ08_005256 [Neonectria magnoliae]|uniref:Uncharacterized protein n=1 Tax=Neonectria magnoliae TaxID=2732573 RepID=A0ABR1I3R5_9HYPO
MPPIRTPKNNAAAPAPAVNALAMMMQRKPVGKGVKDAQFACSVHNWDDNYKRVIGTSTTSLVFGTAFVLTDDHIDDIIALGSLVCKSLTQFISKHADVSYDSPPGGAQLLTTDAVVRLVKACPNLRIVQLQATRLIADKGLLGLFKYCPKLTLVEVTGPSRDSSKILSGQALDELRENPQWAPKLKMLILGETESNKEFMKAMRALTKEREKLVVRLLQRSEEKNYGDWDLVESRIDYQNGRKKPKKW